MKSNKVSLSVKAFMDRMIYEKRMFSAWNERVEGKK